MWFAASAAQTVASFAATRCVSATSSCGTTMMWIQSLSSHKRPTQLQKRPTQRQKRPTHLQKRPIQQQIRPIHLIGGSCRSHVSRETYKRDLQKRPTKETNKRDQQKRPNRDLQKRPTKETYKRNQRKRLKRDPHKTPTKETYKRDLQKRTTEKTYTTDYQKRPTKETNTHNWQQCALSGPRWAEVRQICGKRHKFIKQDPQRDIYALLVTMCHVYQ